MNAIYAAAAEVQRVFTEQGWHFCVIGGLAVIRWGRRRTTEDADFSLLTGFGDQEPFLRVIASHFPGRSSDEAAFARDARVYRGYASNGAQIDIAFAGFPFEEETIQRSTLYEFAPGCVLPVCSAEDLMVMKAFAGRPQDWADVEYVAAGHWNSLDWKRIDHDLAALCELAENNSSVPTLADLKERLERTMKRGSP